MLKVCTIINLWYCYPCDNYFNYMIENTINAKNLKEADVVLLLAPYEKSVSIMGGTSVAPKKIAHCVNHYIDLFDSNLFCEPFRKIKTAQKEIHGIQKLNPEDALTKIATEYQKLFKEGKFVILLGGEHSVSLGAFNAISKTMDPKDVTIVQIDAHHDLRDNDNDQILHNKPSKFAHSCVMRRAHELGYPLVQIGVRSFSQEEHNYIKKNKKSITFFEWGYNKKVPTIEQILKTIKTKYIYISIDVDGFDPAYMPGTGVPVQGGLEWWYGVRLIKIAINKKKLIGADIVEVSPQKDTIVSEYGAAKLCYVIMTNKFKNRMK